VTLQVSNVPSTLCAQPCSKQGCGRWSHDATSFSVRKGCLVIPTSLIAASSFASSQNGATRKPSTKGTRTYRSFSLSHGFNTRAIARRYLQNLHVDTASPPSPHTHTLRHTHTHSGQGRYRYVVPLSLEASFALKRCDGSVCVLRAPANTTMPVHVCCMRSSAYPHPSVVAASLNRLLISNLNPPPPTHTPTPTHPHHSLTLTLTPIHQHTNRCYRCWPRRRQCTPSPIHPCEPIGLVDRCGARLSPWILPCMVLAA
jgi:hypothetical protein